MNEQDLIEMAIGEHDEALALEFEGEFDRENDLWEAGAYEPSFGGVAW